MLDGRPFGNIAHLVCLGSAAPVAHEKSEIPPCIPEKPRYERVKVSSDAEEMLWGETECAC
jgi:hypothetical protein